MSITTNGELRAAITNAEMCAARLTMRGHHLTIGERAVIARLLRDLADVGRRAFDPDAVRGLPDVPVPREYAAHSLFSEGAA